MEWRVVRGVLGDHNSLSHDGRDNTLDGVEKTGFSMMIRARVIARPETRRTSILRTPDPNSTLKYSYFFERCRGNRSYRFPPKYI